MRRRADLAGGVADAIANSLQEDTGAGSILNGRTTAVGGVALFRNEWRGERNAIE